MNSTKLKTFFVILKSAAAVACFGIFFSQALNPSLSFCPYKVRKSKDYPLSTEQFLNFSYKWEDIFTCDTVAAFQNSSVWDNFVVHGPYVGTCFTLNLKTAPSAFNTNFTIRLLPNITLHVFVHEPGEEFWLYIREFPAEVPTLLVDFKTGLTTAFFEIRIAEKSLKRLNTRYKPCDETISTKDFISCINQTAIEMLLKNGLKLKCMGIFTEIFHKFDLPSCTNVQESEKSWKNVEEVLIKLLLSHKELGCNIPCDRKYYKASLTQAGESYFESSPVQNDVAKLFVFYYSTDTEVITESLILDSNTLLSAIGGSLGLLDSLS